MGDLAEEAHCLYTKLMGYQQSRIGQQDDEAIRHVHQQRQNITALILQFICVCPPESRFKYGEFTKIISDSSRSLCFEPEKAVQAFLCLEDYISLLYLMPWKTEYQNIKKYGGHYQTKIASHLKGAEIILSLIGFTDLTTGLMILSHHTKQDVLLYIAFECLVASSECLVITQIWRKVRDNPKVRMSEVVQLRSQNSGNADVIVNLVESRYGEINRGQGEQIEHVVKKSEKRNPLKTRDSSLFHDKLQEHMKKVNKINTSAHDDIPYMDEDAKEIDRKPENFEDHLLASLQLVDTEKAPPPCGIAPNPQLRPSQEWAFVREGLEKNYGNKYFDGPREDILKQQQQDLAKQGGYVQMIAEPKYENGPFHKFNQVGTPNTFSNLTEDSAYQSASPKLLEPGLLRGQIKSDIILKKDPIRVSIDSQKGHTAPITKRLPDMSKASSTFPGKHAKVPVQMENIQKYHKATPSSMPIHIHTEHRPATTDINRKSSSYSQATQVGQRSLTNVLDTRTNHSSVEPTGTGSVKEPRIAISNAGTSHRNIDINIPVAGTSISNQVPVTNQVPVGRHTVNIPPVIDRTTKIALQWQCAYCTYLNTSPDSICVMCYKTREGTEVDGPVAGDMSRVCAKCTLENSPNASICTACGNELKGMQTVI